MSCLKMPCGFCMCVCIYEQLTVSVDFLFYMFVELKIIRIFVYLI